MGFFSRCLRMFSTSGPNPLELYVAILPSQTFVHIFIVILPQTTMTIPSISILSAEPFVTPDVSSYAQTAAYKHQQARTAADATYHTEQLAVLDKLLASTPG